MRPNKAARIAKAAQENDNLLASHIGSLAIAIEAIESLLVAEGILSEGDIMKQINALVEQKKRAMELKP